jgi:DNA mismatch repair ATPase MutS
MLEMKEMAFICSNATEKSLVLLDELGRATSNEDGVAIAWAVSEHLLEKRAMTFFVTHYPQLCHLSKVYPSVQNQHLSASVSSVEAGGIRYTHKLTSGPCSVTTDYGVEMASSCGWPDDVVHDVSLTATLRRKNIKLSNSKQPFLVRKARQIKKSLGKLSEENMCSSASPEATAAAIRNLFLKQLAKELSSLVQNETSITSLRTNLHRLRVSVARSQDLPQDQIKEYLCHRDSPLSSA